MLAKNEVIFWWAEGEVMEERGEGDLFIGQNILSGRSMKQQEKVSSVGTFISSFHSSRHPSSTSTSTSTSTQLNRYVVKTAEEFDGLC